LPTPFSGPFAALNLGMNASLGDAIGIAVESPIDRVGGGR
jgi:hypothetical protein